ncbi:uncharacterized protein B0H18DRAFT_1062400, partial [Fomitopsis serialis]|uniref:uncharacterized protein n=1 Tax=Fomitopsis serialis TaxID=139415 RepID=UPI00200870CE
MLYSLCSPKSIPTAPNALGTSKKRCRQVHTGLETRESSTTPGSGKRPTVPRLARTWMHKLEDTTTYDAWLFFYKLV